MEGKGPRQERETIILFNEEDDDDAEVYTASEIVYRQMLKRGYQPSEDRQRGCFFKMPKSEIKLPRPKRPVTEAERARRVEMGKRLGATRKNAIFSSGDKEIV